jgi:phosphoglycolate phosphatase
MPYKLAILDFDGTLADSFPFFVSVFNQLAEEHGFNKVDPGEAHELRRYDAKQLMQRLNMPAWKLPKVTAGFIALMNRNRSRIPLFEGVSDVLPELAGRGLLLAIVSSNSAENVREVLGPANSALVTDFECGVSIFGKRARLRKVLKQTGVAPREAIYIGDQASDFDAARAERIAFGAVSWGYGEFESLRALGPEEAFAGVADIRRIAGGAS